METPSTTSGLPENAYKELKPGETYRPVMDPNQSYPEVTGWSVGWGLVMAVLFSAAAAYSGLKIGQVFEAGNDNDKNRFPIFSLSHFFHHCRNRFPAV